MHHTLPPTSSATQADVSTDRPLQAMSQGLRTEAVPGVQGTGPGFFSGRSRARKRRGISATEPLAFSPTVPLAISPTVHTVPLHTEPLGISATGPPPAKRAPPVSRAALSAAQNPSPVPLLQQAARMMGFSLADGPGQGPDAAVELAPAPTLERRPQDIPPAALGAPPGEETFPGSDIYPMPVHDVDSESSLSGSVLTTAADPEATAADLRLGDKAQTLLRKYLPQFYCTDQGSEGQAETPASLLFRGRADSGAGIPLTDDFQQEYARISREPKLSTPSALRRSYRFQPKDFEKFLSPETLSPEILRVADKKPQGNPLKGKAYMERDKKWTRVAELARTSMRLSAYTGAITNLLAQANELRVSLEDRQTLHEVLLALSEAMWSQAARTAVFTTRQRRTMALGAMGFATRDADQIGRSLPHEGPHLFAGQAIRVFDEECAYRKRADETAARFLQARQTRPGRRGGPSTAFRPAGRQVTVTLPAPVPAPQAHRGRGRARPSGSRRRGGRSFYRAPYRGGQGF